MSKKTSKNEYILRLLPDGDIDIILLLKEKPYCYERVYHRTYYMGDDLKTNLMEAYDYLEHLQDNEISVDMKKMLDDLEEVI